MMRSTGARADPVTENQMQHSVPLHPSPIAFGETRGDRAQVNARNLVRAFRTHLMHCLRALGDFLAAGGPLS